MSEPVNDEIELREQLAAIEHQRWADWQMWVHSKLEKVYKDGELMGLYLPEEFYDRWQNQIITPYSQLSEKEKQSDREQVDRYFHLITSQTKKAYADGVKADKKTTEQIVKKAVSEVLDRIGDKTNDFYTMKAIQSERNKLEGK